MPAPDLNQEYEDRFGVAPSAEESALLAEALELAQRIAGTALFEVSDTLIMTGSGRSALMLPDKPVSDVSEVRVDGVALDASAWGLHRKVGVLVRYSGCWPNDTVDNVEVDWTHGPSAFPGVVLGMILEAARSAGGSAPVQEVQSETWGSHTVAYRAETGSSVGFRRLEEQRIASYGINAVIIGRNPLAGGRG